MNMNDSVITPRKLEALVAVFLGAYPWQRILILAALLAASCDDMNNMVPIHGNLIAIDGDTFKVSGGQHYRLARIDAPEMPGHCRPGRQCVVGDPFAAQRALQWLLDRGSPVACKTVAVDVYRRKVVECDGYGGENLSDALLGMGQAQPYRGENSHVT